MTVRFVQACHDAQNHAVIEQSFAQTKLMIWLTQRDDEWVCVCACDAAQHLGYT